ncbi:dnaJ domain-containing protein [Ditylenchus destructor]|uniref:DnaJ domain-containing protein n=1 Tax=Ditylenchus destructor TaxID=166010 RepID=A0AAD4MHJ5_9BILA|nr:dnaJ domain-containing protein [Ditylenchus destructor]
MPKDYYLILGISRNASSSEIRKAYYKLALESHPDKTKDHGAEAKFKEVAEAYSVLSDPKKRKIFDESWDDQRNGRSRANDSRGFEYFTFQDDPMQMFRRAFGSSESFTDNNEFSDPFKFMGVRMDNTGRRKQNTPTTHDVQVPLSDIWSGCSKKMKISRKIFSPDGAFRTEDKVLTVNIEPGARNGTKITFPGEGIQKPGYAPGDIVFIIREEPHPKFKREECDIRYIQKLSLRDALCGISIRIATLSGAIIPFKSTKVITPNSTERIAEHGLPDPNNGGKRGDLIIEFHVRFPVILLSDSIQLKQLRGTWLDGAVYYCNNFDAVKAVIDSLEAEDAASIRISQELFNKQGVAHQLAYIQCNFSILPKAITKLESQGLTLSQNLEVLAEVKTAISNAGGHIGQKIQTKLDFVMQNNPGLSKMA